MRKSKYRELSKITPYGKEEAELQLELMQSNSKSEFQLINVKRMKEMENHHWNTTIITVAGKIY